MSKIAKEISDLCEFCTEFWGENKRNSCKTPCVCATYVNQDYVYQREFTMGLPSPKSWKATVSYSEGGNFWENLSLEAKKRVGDKLAPLLVGLDPVLQQVLTLLLMGLSKEEVCTELDILSNTYDKYVERLKRTAKEINLDASFGNM